MKDINTTTAATTTITGPATAGPFNGRIAASIFLQTALRAVAGLAALTRVGRWAEVNLLDCTASIRWPLAAPKAPTATLMMGLPAAGKSTYRRNDEALSALEALDCDELKELIPGYSPKAPMEVHEFSKALERLQLKALLAAGQDFVWDGTLSSVRSATKKVALLRAAGFRVRIVFVKVSLATSLARNAARERNVPTSVVREKFAEILGTFEVLRTLVDEVQVVNNEGPSNQGPGAFFAPTLVAPLAVFPHDLRPSWNEGRMRVRQEMLRTLQKMVLTTR